MSDTDAPSKAGSAACLKGEQRLNIYTVDPDNVQIEETPGRPFYDPRASLPLAEDDIKNVLLYGVIEPIILASVDGHPTVVDGRQRTRWAREANRRLKRQNLVPLRVPAIYRRGTDMMLHGVMVAANEIRRADDLVTSAEKAQRLLDLGMVEEDAAITLGVGRDAFRNRLKILELAPRVQAAIRSGKVGGYAALQLHGLPAEEQVAKLDEMMTNGTSRRDMIEERQKAGAIRANGGGGGTRSVPKKRALALAKWAAKEQWLTREARLILEWVMGLADDDDAAKRVPGFREFLDREANRKANRKARKRKAPA